MTSRSDLRPFVGADVAGPIDDYPAHDGRCYCGALTPCEEADCTGPAGHEYICPECLARERRRPADPLDVALERRFDALDGY